MAHHEHVEVLVEGVDGVRPGRIGGTGQHIRVRGDGDDVRCVPATGALGVIRVDAAALDRGQGVLDETRLVEGVGVDVGLYPAASATVRQASMAAGVVPQSSCSLNPAAPPRNCSHIASALTVLPLPQQRDVERPGIERLQHPGQVPGARGHRGGLAALGRTGAAGHDRGDAAAEGLFHDLRTDQVDVAVDRAGGQDAAVARDDLGGRTDHQVRVHAGHDVGVAGLADGDDAAVTDPDVGLDDSPVSR